MPFTNPNYNGPTGNVPMPTEPPPPGQKWHNASGRWVLIPDRGSYSFTSRLKGAGKGAATGFMVSGGNPMGALAGGGAGFLAPGLTGEHREGRSPDDIQRGAMADAIARQEDLRHEMDQRRARDLEATMGFYGPAQAALTNLYGIPASAWGPGMPGNRPPGPGAGPAAGMTAAPMRPDLRSLFERQPLSGLPAGTRLSSNLPRKSYSSLFQRRG
jgi:hypothetical protein